MFQLVNKSSCSLDYLNREEDDEGDEVEFTTKLGKFQCTWTTSHAEIYSHVFVNITGLCVNYGYLKTELYKGMNKAS